jgi:hypothetical protein
MDDIIIKTADGNHLIRWSYSERDNRFLAIQEERGSSYESRVIPTAEARLIMATRMAKKRRVMVSDSRGPQWDADFFAAHDADETPYMAGHDRNGY